MQKWLTALMVGVLVFVMPATGFAADIREGYTKEIQFTGVDMTGEYPDSEIYGIDENGVINQKTADDYNNGLPALSPDGTRIAFSYWQGIVLIDAADGGNREVLPVKGTPTWSPDGKKLAYVYEDELKTYDLETGEVTLVYQGQDSNGLHMRDPQWSPQGDQILFTFKGHLWTVKVDGTGLTQLTAEGEIYRGAYSSDGAKIVYSGRESDDTVHWIKIMNADGTNPTTVMTNHCSIENRIHCFLFNPVFDPDNNQVIAYSKLAPTGNVEIFTYDLKRKKEKQITTSDQPFDPYGDVGKRTAAWGWVKNKN